jgi:phosphate butyryltransferase
MSKSFEDLLSKVRQCTKKVLSVACAEDEAVLEAASEAHQMGIVDVILTGNEEKIKEIAARAGIDVSPFEIINCADAQEAALTAVKLVHDGKADMYMKGLLPTKDFLKSVLNKEVGLRTGKPLSHVCVFEIPGIDRLLFLSDVAFIPYPSYDDKKAIINYCTEVARACGVEKVHVALLAAVEVVNPKMLVTVEADLLRQAGELGEFGENVIVDGPLSLDIALYEEAAAEKGAQNRPCAAKADVLVFPDIHSGNLVYKSIVHMVPSVRNGNILTGTLAPVILTSRSDSKDIKINSIALAAVLSEHNKTGGNA